MNVRKLTDASFTDFVAKDREALMQRLDKALCWVTDRATDNQRTCGYNAVNFWQML